VEQNYDDTSPESDITGPSQKCKKAQGDTKVTEEESHRHNTEVRNDR